MLVNGEFAIYKYQLLGLFWWIQTWVWPQLQVLCIHLQLCRGRNPQTSWRVVEPDEISAKHFSQDLLSSILNEPRRIVSKKQQVPSVTNPSLTANVNNST
jgi:hypothetical protein